MSEQRNGCLTAIMGVFGVILLLPGLCVLLLGGASITSGTLDPGLGPFMVPGLLMGALGVILIRAGIRGTRR